MRRLVLAALSTLALVTIASPTLALSQQLENRGETTVNKLNDRFQKEREEILNKLNDRFRKEREETLDS